MTIYPLILDREAPYLKGAGGSASTLLALCGFELVIDRLQRALLRLTDHTLSVVTMFEPDAAYRERLTAHGVQPAEIAPLSGLDRLLTRFEPSDWLLILDAATQPADVDDLGRLTADRAEDYAARHLVYLEQTSTVPREYVQLDPERVVRRIQRYYPGVTWLQTRSVIASLVPASAVQQLAGQALRSPAELRAALAAIGLVSRDVAAGDAALDLHEESGLLGLCARMLGEARESGAPRGFKEIRPDVWVAGSSRFDPSVRFHGPVVLHADATVEAHATLIGPLMVGAGSRIGRGAALVRSIVLPDTRIPPSAAVRHQVTGGALDAGRPAGGAGSATLWLAGAAAAGRGARADARPRVRRYVTAKALVEGVAALVGLILIAPVLLAAAIAVRVTSRGPILFGHEREGLGGRPFRCWKFRTMVPNAHSMQRALYKASKIDGPQFKLDKDPRLTPVGGWLRSTNIDELPQLINVVLGQMSLIGPRPSPFRENQICVPWRKARLSVRPGITGLWQICRTERKLGDFHQWIYYDMLYVRHMSFWLDAKILMATVLTCGGRWSVPLTWLVPRARLDDLYANAAHPTSAVASASGGSTPRPPRRSDEAA